MSRNCDRCLQDSADTTTVCFDRKSKKSFILCLHCLTELTENATPVISTARRW